ncbi:MAG: DnaJ domain-containing protein [Alphaproteobacteria bacterium]
MATVATDLSDVLGVARDATEEAIRKAYRGLAKKHNPDLSPGDAAAEETFNRVQRACKILFDAKKRRQYDPGEIDVEGNDIHVEVPVAIDEAVLGAKIFVPTVAGAVTKAVPAGSNDGSKLRHRGKGVHAAGGGTAGEQIVTLRIVLPKEPDDELKAFL